LEKIWFFGVKSWFFTRNTPTTFAPPSARRNFFNCAPPPPPPPPPLTWNPGSVPGYEDMSMVLWRYVPGVTRSKKYTPISLLNYILHVNDDVWKKILHRLKSNILFCILLFME
jgi:hypothetical protein